MDWSIKKSSTQTTQRPKTLINQVIALEIQAEVGNISQFDKVARESAVYHLMQIYQSEMKTLTIFTLHLKKHRLSTILAVFHCLVLGFSLVKQSNMLFSITSQTPQRFEEIKTKFSKYAISNFKWDRGLLSAPSK